MGISFAGSYFTVAKQFPNRLDPGLAEFQL